jgi:hypothetical protein
VLNGVQTVFNIRLSASATHCFLRNSLSDVQGRPTGAASAGTIAVTSAVSFDGVIFRKEQGFRPNHGQEHDTLNHEASSNAIKRLHWSNAVGG